VRCNVGVPPEKLTDQHLIAEYRELPMVFGSLRYNNFIIKSDIPETFSLGKGHMNFFKDKFVYLQNRFYLLKDEMLFRGFVPKMDFPDISVLDRSIRNDWEPTQEANTIIRNRIYEKIMMKPGWYRFHHLSIVDSTEFDLEYFNRK